MLISFFFARFDLIFSTIFFITILAEAALRGLIAGGDDLARAYYEEGVKLMFEQHDLALHAANPYNGALAPIPGTAGDGSAAKAAAEFLAQTEDYGFLVNWDLMTSNEQKLEAIMTQKWLGYYLIDPLEAWLLGKEK